MAGLSRVSKVLCKKLAKLPEKMHQLPGVLPALIGDIYKLWQHLLKLTNGFLLFRQGLPEYYAESPESAHYQLLLPDN